MRMQREVWTALQSGLQQVAEGAPRARTVMPGFRRTLWGRPAAEVHGCGFPGGQMFLDP